MCIRDRLHMDGGNCSIGKPEIVGDFTVQSTNKNPLNFGDSRDCAIKDCKAYIEYQRMIGKEGYCAV